MRKAARPALSLLLLAGYLAAAISCSAKPAVSRPETATASAAAPAIFAPPAWAVVSKAELDQYGFVYALSDVHGARTKLNQLLKASGLIKGSGGKMHWLGDTATKRQVLLIFTGDYIDKNEEDGAGTLVLIESLQKEAAARGDRIIATLGNHESEFLANPGDCKKTFRDSARYEMDDPDLKCKGILKTPFGKFMRNLPIGAVVGSWMFVHSGFINLKPTESVEANRKETTQFFTQMNAKYLKGDHSWLGGTERSILSMHDWIMPHHKAVAQMYAWIGIDKLVVGHEPGALGRKGELARSSDGWLTKLDAGMNAEADDSNGYLLRCRPPEMTCEQVDSKGNASPIPVGGW